MKKLYYNKYISKRIGLTLICSLIIIFIFVPVSAANVTNTNQLSESGAVQLTSLKETASDASSVDYSLYVGKYLPYGARLTSNGNPVPGATEVFYRSDDGISWCPIQSVVTNSAGFAWLSGYTESCPGYVYYKAIALGASSDPFLVQWLQTDPPTTCVPPVSCVVPTTPTPISLPRLYAERINWNPSTPEFGQEYTISIDVNNPTTTQTSRTITATEYNDTFAIADKEWIPQIPYTVDFTNSPETQSYHFYYMHTADPFEPLRKQGDEAGYTQPLKLLIESSVDHYLNVWELAQVSTSEVAGVASKFLTLYNTYQFWQQLKCTPVANYHYTFNTTEIYTGSNLVPPNIDFNQKTFTVTVTAPFWKYTAFENGITNEIISLTYSYIGDLLITTGPEGAATSFVLTQVSIAHNAIAEWMFQTAVDPTTEYTQPIVLTPYTISGLDAIPDGPIKDYARQLEITASHARALKDATINYNAASQANDTVWETKLLEERYKYQSMLSDDFSSLQKIAGPMSEELHNDNVNPTVNDIEAIKQNISQNGLPDQQITLLKSHGYSDENIASIQNLTLMVPDSVVENYSASINNLLSASEYFNMVTLGNLTADLGDQAPPYANFIASATTGTTPLTIQFTDTSLRGPNQWEWSFGDGATATTQNPAHTYTAAGIYSVNLTVTNSTTGSDTRTKYEYITVYPPPPIANFTANATSGQVPLAVAFTDTSSNMPTQWAWDFGDGSNATIRNPVHMYVKPGNYTVSLKATNAGGSNTITRTGFVTVRPIPWKVEILPNVINLKSKGVFIAFVELPKPYDANKVINGTVFCNGAPAKTLIRIGKFPKVFGAIFRTSDLKGVQSGNKVQFTVNGTVNYNGQLLAFSGNDTVRVLNLRITAKDDTEDIASQSASVIFDKFYDKK